MSKVEEIERVIEQLPAEDVEKLSVWLEERRRKYPKPTSGTMVVREVDLRASGISEANAADLRARFKTFAEDWERPEASIYDEDRPR